MDTIGRSNETMLPVYALAAFAVISWGVTPAMTALQVSELPAVLGGIMRSALTVPVAIVCILALRLRVPSDNQTWFWLVFSGLAAFCGFPILFTMGVAATSTTHAALILACMPVVSGGLGAVLDKRMPRYIWFVGAAMALIGEVFLIGSRDATGEATLEGDLLVAAGAVLAGVGYVAGSRVTGVIGTWSTTFWGIAIAGALQIPVMIWLAWNVELAAVTWIGWSTTAFLVMFSTVLAYAAWYWALNRGTVVRVAPIQFAQPVVSVVVAVLILGEALTSVIVVSTLMVIGGIVLASRGRKVPQTQTAGDPS